MKEETAGDPSTGLRWTRKTTQKISLALRCSGIDVSGKTVGRILKKMGYALRANQKKISTGCPKERDEQFNYIHEVRQEFTESRLPVISIDTKKKELVGNFKNPGSRWGKEPTAVKDHDFRSHASCIAVPYGIYDVAANRGHVFLGTSSDTSEFAVDAVAGWWESEGRRRYRGAKQLLILADNGGSNGPRTRAWKYFLQEEFCDRYKCRVTVCHYPPGTSKWNPIEHRLFSEISKNWAAKPLDKLATMLNYIRTTTTTTGLKVLATLVRRHYAKGVKVADETFKELNLVPHTVLPRWNYTLSPRC